MIILIAVLLIATVICLTQTYLWWREERRADAPLGDEWRTPMKDGA